MNTANTPAKHNEAPETIDAAVVPTLVAGPSPGSDVRTRGEMKRHPGIPSRVHLDSALETRFNIGAYTDGPVDAQPPKPYPLVGRYPESTERSPWLDPAINSLFRYEFQLARENLPYEQFKPLAIYSWIECHGGEGLFFRGLARYAPMFPVFAYNGQVASWISPPPSGFGNAICMVMGHDKTGMLRLVGGNSFTEPSLHVGEPLMYSDFFAQYDMSDDRGKQRLVLEAVSKSISPKDKSLLHDIRRECEHFHTMAIYITVLTSEGCLFHAAKAVIEGVKPADFSYEYFGEIK